MKKSKKIVALLLAALSIVSASASVLPASAVSHTASAYHGFEVDLDSYERPAWYNSVTTNCYKNGCLIGTCTTDIGVARAKQKATGGYYGPSDGSLRNEGKKSQIGLRRI